MQSIPAGETTALPVLVLNGGAAAIFDIDVVDSLGFVTGFEPSVLSVGTSESAIVEVAVSVPEDTVVGTQFEVTLTATNFADSTLFNSATATLIVEEDMLEIEADLDIMPRDCPNEFKPRIGNSGHRIDIALVGTDEFNVRDVDLSTILLSRTDGVGGSVSPDRVRVKDRATPFEGEPCNCHDLRKDGIDDLRMRFFAVAMTLEMELDLLAAGESLELTVTGELLDGTLFVASDCIVIDESDDESDDDSDS